MFNAADLQSLLDVSRSFDEPKVRLLEQLVNQMLMGKDENRRVAHEVLSQLKANTEAWRVVGTILQLSQDSNTRFFALSILEECITRRWNVFPDEQKAGIKQYVTDMTIAACTDTTLADAKYFITKVNETLIQIVKHEWPHNWPSFIPDLCAAARTNQAICENSMRILSLLSEEVFDFGRDYMTSQKVHMLMSSLNDQFQQIYDLCMFVISNSVASGTPVSPSLLTATLQCLSHFVKWIPYSYLFDTKLIDMLLQYFWEPTQHRIDCVRCLTEISSLKDVPGEGRIKLKTALWIPLIQKLSQLSDATLDFDTRCHANSRIFWETFYCQLAICLTTLLKNHRVDVCETEGDGDSRRLMLFALEFLVKMTSRINHEETFKILVDYWHHLSEALLVDVRTSHKAASAFQRTSPLMLDDTLSSNGAELAPLESPELYSEHLRAYRLVLNDVRKALILKMARPQEVCIHYDEESGTVDRDYETDTDEVALYNLMRETLVYLTNLGGQETEDVMVALLETFTEDAKNPNQRNWNPTVLSRLCWAIGSISGAMSPGRERKFLVNNIRELLWLCEHKRGKDNKAIVASMIMYVFGQYPRFLRAHVAFLETVIKKLFEFMKETFQGVQDMACETFLKISLKCAKSLAIPPSNQKVPGPLIDGILPQLSKLYKTLETPKQQLMLYEGAGHIVGAAGTLEQKQVYITELMKPFNSEWGQIIIEFATSAATQSEAVYQPQVARKMTEILRVNERVASATGTAFSSQLMSIYQDMLRVYNFYSSRISYEVAQQGPVIMQYTNVKALRSVKRASILLVQTFVDSAAAETSSQNSAMMNGNQSDMIRQQIVQFIMPPLLEPVLQDYRSNVPQARDFEVLSLLTTLTAQLGTHILPELPKIFEFVFDCTLDMIKSDFHSFPDHRTRFYDLLKACSEHCFEGLFTLPELQRRYFIESLVWAFKHEQPSVAEQGLTITQNLLKKVCSTNADFLLPFCRTFYWSILTEILGVLTDTLHKSGFQNQALILMHLVQLVELGRVNDPESHITKPEVMTRLAELLIANFGNLNRKQVEAFVLGLFNKSGSPKEFSQHLRDFLVQLKEFAGADELFEVERQQAIKEAQELEMRRRMQVPGMLPQYAAAEVTRVEDLE